MKCNTSKIFIFFFVLQSICFLSYGQKKGNTITVIVRLKAPSDSLFFSIAPLKYDKSFAFSFTLDDGLVSDYLVAYPFFQGGRVAGSHIDHLGKDQGGDGQYYTGLYFTDGCGNKVSFKPSIAINAKSIDSAEPISNPGFLTWKQVDILFKSGWGVLNHSYSHATGRNVDVYKEIEKNNKIVNRDIGFTMKGFVVPGGHNDKISNGPYAQAAFNLGMETVQNEHYGNYLIKIDTIRHLENLQLGRLFMHTIGDSILWIRSGPNQRIKGNYEKLFSTINSHLAENKPFWINAFTHGVGNQNIWGISMTFPDFTNFFDEIEARYGQKGNDNIWMAPTQEVYDYLLNARLIKFTSRKKKKKIKMIISKNSLPTAIRYHELSVTLSGRKKIKSVKCRGCTIESYSNHNKYCLINFKWE